MTWLGTKDRIARAFATLALAFIASASALAQTPASYVVPNFWDPNVRLERPDPGPPRVIRFLTDDDFPPMHFATPDGGVTGFSVELARAVCEKLVLTCTVQARRFDTLLDSLAEGRGDVLAAAIPVTRELRERFAASHLYHRSPARFVTTRGNAQADLDLLALQGKRVAVIAGTAHQAFLERLAPFVQRREVSDMLMALTLLRSGDAEYVFGDGFALALALAGRGGSELAFAGGPYLESRYFGEGVSFLLRKDELALKRAIDYALQALWDDGTYARLFIRFFPVSPY
ncbi:transporter substrate-binding domain-containing protein [Bosea sp. (in: a-proteobacteria)]|uniref:transporter substrate-binding domain-containing protein n=1 Tax=Bosea sp. (in: a-proteobacteria) TaxID=1871050 RepID=UPI002FCC258C